MVGLCIRLQGPIKVVLVVKKYELLVQIRFEGCKHASLIDKVPWDKVGSSVFMRFTNKWVSFSMISCCAVKR